MKKELGKRVKKANGAMEEFLDKADHYTSFGGRMHHLVHRFFRYSLIGVPSFFIDFFVLWLLTSNGLFYLYSVIVSFLVGHSFNYTLNKIWAFRDSKISFFQGYWRFVILGIVSLMLTEGLMYVFTDQIGFHYLLSRVLAAILVSLFNFGMNFFFTFRIHRNGK